MKKLACLVVLATILPVVAWADCTYPKKPAKAPNGNRATRDEMLSAKKVQDQYQTDVSSYLKCLKDDYDASLAKQPTLTEDQKKKVTKRWEDKNDAAVDEAQSVADSFNEQVRVFKAKSAK